MIRTELRTMVNRIPAWVQLVLGLACLGTVSGAAQGQDPVDSRGSRATSTMSTAAATIEFWHPKRMTFGLMGTPQRWINLLGNVSDPAGVTSLSYSLNGGASVPLSIGPDTRRLARAGDFNIDILYRSLRPLPDSNVVAVTARNGSGAYAYDTVIVRCIPGTVWPRVSNITWADTKCIDDTV